MQTRAVEFVEREAQRINEAFDSLKVSEDLRNSEYISLGMMLKLAENGVLLMILPISTVMSLSGCCPSMVSRMTPRQAISSAAARSTWFDDEPEAGEASDAAPEAVSGDEPATSWGRSERRMTDRTRILSGQNLPREQLIRFVAGPYGHAVADLACKLPPRVY